jgi:hypothetical protein
VKPDELEKAMARFKAENSFKFRKVEGEYSAKPLPNKLFLDGMRFGDYYIVPVNSNTA